MLTAGLLFAVGTLLAVAGDDEPESGSAKPGTDKPAAASDEGRQAMAGFRKPEGWDVELFAAEPLLANPVAMTVDNRGRVFVCESFRQDRGVTDNRGHDEKWLMADLAAQSVQDRIDYHKRLLGSEIASFTAHDDRIRMLVDTDGDGTADHDSVFADGFNNIEDGTGAGILVRGNVAFYTCIPKLWRLEDTDADGRADQRSALVDGLGVRVAFRGHDAHGLIIGPDGRLYFSIGDRGYNIQSDSELNPADGSLKNPESGAVFRCELDGSRLEVFASGLRNPQELAFDDYGYLFTGDNNSDSGDKARWVNVMQGGDSGWRMMYQYLPDRGPFNREKLWQPYSAVTPAYIVPPIANISDGPSGLACYPGTGLVGDYNNCFFLADFRGGRNNSGIRLIRSQPQGAFWSVERSEEPIWQILATDLAFGPDGGLWVCDWVDGWVGEGKGRIYRFIDASAQQQDTVQEVQQALSEGFAELTAERLGGLLRHPDRRLRLEAQWELAQRGTLEPFLTLVADPGAGTLPRIHAVWGLGQAARLNQALLDQLNSGIQQALADDDLDVRRVAATVVGDLQLSQFSSKLVELIGDPEPRVQYAACLAAGQLGIAQAVVPTAELLAANADADPGLRHAGIMALKGISDPADVLALRTHPSASVRLAAVVAMRKRDDPQLAAFLQDESVGVQLEAARAIHDVVALHSALPTLADSMLPAAAPDALSHRWLNANFRVAGPQAELRIADFAADENRSEAMRIDALDMLASWADPGQLDRVMNRFLPLPERDATVAREVVLAKLPRFFSGTDRMLQATIDAVQKLGITEASDSLRDLARDTTNEPKLRAAAAVGFVGFEKENAAELVRELVSDSQDVVRSSALGLLSQLDPSAALPALQSAITSPAMLERQAAWDALGAMELAEASELVDDGAQRYMQGGLPPDVWLNVIEAVRASGSPAIRAQLDEFSQQLASNDPLEAYRSAAFGGDSEAGQLLFFTRTELSCVRCHRVGETGGEVGPILTTIGKMRDNRYLLESIVSPDAKIAENYETVVLLTEDDEVITGILRKETPTLIELVDADGKIMEIDPLEIASRRKGKSSMPADLVKSLTARELRDMVAYLSSLQ